MDIDIETLKKCNKILRDCNVEDIIKHSDLLEEIRDRLDLLLESIDENRENETLKFWINAKYVNCVDLRSKIELVSLERFYYTEPVPICFDKLQNFYRSVSCYCGKCE